MSLQLKPSARKPPPDSLYNSLRLEIITSNWCIWVEQAGQLRRSLAQSAGSYFTIFKPQDSRSLCPETVETSRTHSSWGLSITKSILIKEGPDGMMGSTYQRTLSHRNSCSSWRRTQLWLAHLAWWVVSQACQMWLRVSQTRQAPRQHLSTTWPLVPRALLDLVLSRPPLNWMPCRYRWGNTHEGCNRHPGLATSTSVTLDSRPSMEWTRAFLHSVRTSALVVTAIEFSMHSLLIWFSKEKNASCCCTISLFQAKCSGGVE